MINDPILVNSGLSGFTFWRYRSKNNIHRL